jgi:hypothetical protein
MLSGNARSGPERLGYNEKAMEFKPPVLKSLRLVNYRSIRDETIVFHNPMFMVGRNGAGKSNVVDALAFLSDALTLGLDFAVNSRSWGNSLFYMNTRTDHSMDFYIETEFGEYILKLKYNKDEGFYIFEESCDTGVYNYGRSGNALLRSNMSGILGDAPKFNSKNLVLPLINGDENIGKIYDCISAFKVYAISSSTMRNREMSGGSSGGGFLEKEGGNISAVYAQSKSYTRGVNMWLPYLVPGMKIFSGESPNGSKILGFEEKLGVNSSRNLFIVQVSDGTLAAIGNLMALYQKNKPSVIVLEEPENNLHYGALAVLIEAIQDVAAESQIIVTTHSPELIDEKWMMPENIRVVEKVNGETRVRVPSEGAAKLIREHLMYPGQLLRANILDPKVDDMME